MDTAPRILIAAGTPEETARLSHLVRACELGEAVEVPFARVVEVIARGSADDVIVLGWSGPSNETLAALDAIAQRPIAPVLVADELTEEVATAAHAVDAPVCLYRHGSAPLRHAIVRAARASHRRRTLDHLEHAAREREDLRALVYVSVSDVIFQLGVEGDAFRFLEINPAFTKATGLTEAQVVGKLVTEVIPEPSLSLVLSKYREAIAERRTVRWVEVTEYPTGTKYGEVSVTPLVDASGRCTRLVGTVHDVTEERERSEAIRRYADIVRAVQIGLTVWSVREGGGPDAIELLACNPAAERSYGTALAVGASFAELHPNERELLDLVRGVAAAGAVRELPAYHFATMRDPSRVFSLKAFPLPGRCVGVAAEDVSDQARARALGAAERDVLERVASGATLGQGLDALVLAIEALMPSAIASVLLLSRDGKHLVHGSAPHLPEAYNRAIDGARIGPNAGSCGTAAALRRPVIVSDIETDPLWSDYRELARTAGLRACWSTPIMASDGRVLGTFALYHRQPRRPTAADSDLIARATHVATIAIQRHELDEQLRALSARLEEAREEERSGIAREIHDQLGQSLTALKMDLAWITRRAGSPEGLTREGLLEKVSELSHLVSDTIDLVRRISSELRPGVLDDLGLAAALSWQAQEFEKRTDIPCVVDADLEEDGLPRELATAVFRVFQEALTNVVRHAEATVVEVRLSEDDGWLLFEVADDGKGIRPDAVQDTRSLGLLGMRERARRLGGIASFAPREPHGTVVTLRLPRRPDSVDRLRATG